jgi:hypothetical protein
MRYVIIGLIAASCVMSPVYALQTRGAAASPSGPRISACALLTPDIAAKYIHKDIIKYLKPEEEVRGAVGSACEYGRIRLQVNPYGVGTLPTPPSKEWEAVPGLGTGAFYRPLRRSYAELIAWSGKNAITIQLGVNTGSTMETTKAEAIALANALFPKLK